MPSPLCHAWPYWYCHLQTEKRTTTACRFCYTRHVDVGEVATETRRLHLAVRGMKAYRGSRGMAPLIPNSALDWGECSASRHGHFTPGTLWISGWVGVTYGSHVLVKRKTSCLRRGSTNDFSEVVCFCTDRATSRLHFAKTVVSEQGLRAKFVKCLIHICENQGCANYCRPTGMFRHEL